MKTFSNNKKLNAVLNRIHEQLLSIADSGSESIAEIQRYRKSYPKQTDYNLYQFGNLLIYYDEIRELYSEYKSVKCYSNDRLCELYKRQIRFVADYIILHH